MSYYLLFTGPSAAESPSTSPSHSRKSSQLAKDMEEHVEEIKVAACALCATLTVSPLSSHLPPSFSCFPPFACVEFTNISSVCSLTPFVFTFRALMLTVK